MVRPPLTREEPRPCLTPPTPRTPPPPPSSSLSSVLAVWLCAATGLGCPAAQLRPEPGACPEDARHVMFEELKLYGGSYLMGTLDIHQPADRHDPRVEGTYQDGPIIGRVEGFDGVTDPHLPSGTLLFGRLWTGPGFQVQWGDDAVLGRYTEAVLPDGRKVPVCIVVGGQDGRWAKLPGSKPGAAVLPRLVPFTVVERWP